MTLPQLDLHNEKHPIAILHTNMGDIKIALFPDVAPKTVKNFIELSKKGYYKDVIFHRVIPDFMIQGGDPTGTGMGGESIYGEKFEDEFSDQAFNIRGALSMANAGPNTNGSQFFIVQNSSVPYSKEDFIQGGWPEGIAEMYAAEGGTPHLDNRHTVFGHVIEGLNVVDDIAGTKRGPGDRPVYDVVIESVDIEND
jgi:peptidyl-prolyl cis-trans isomerase B (cyclophilin B)